VGRDGWLRVVGWDDERHGALDRDRIDAVVPDVPVRIQHRSGAVWVLNSRALARVGVDERDGPPGAERDASGRPTGRLWRSDAWLGTRTAGRPPDLAAVGRRLARLGVTAVTDATPDLDAARAGVVAAAVDSGALPQRVLLLGADTPPSDSPRLAIGPRKIVVGDHDLPAPDDLAARITETHDGGRCVAVHCVSRAALALTIAALRAAGARVGDRVEHCALADPAAIGELATLGVAVVTQPTLVARRGDDYLARHDVADRPDLWRFRTLLDAGIPTVASSDAPYGDPDPWLTMRVARDRRTPSGRVLGAADAVAPAVTLAGMLAPLRRPWGPARRVAAGLPADLVLLAVPLVAALAEPTADAVVATVIDGRVTHSR
jgi:predicted amidohydrolase YtcJ